MQEKLPIENPQKTEMERPGFQKAVIGTAVLVLILFVGGYLWTNRSPQPAVAMRDPHGTLGPIERAYLSKIQVENVAMSRAANFLNQEVTTLTADLVNGGDRPLRNVEITVEFFDEMSQLALRETRPAFPPGGQPLAPGERHGFEIAFEHIPSSWNMQQPAIRVTSLQFTVTKQ
jgi:hypothetical protein